ncbi:MAG: type II toxin-antitoxin system PemK/MazF family toxin [Snowella sp.]|nr:type II toxin-antitoxin system PemK/MazF family toxin [Snowella sp.]
MRGDIYLADLNPSRGSEQAGVRPVILVQRQNLDRYH